MGTYQLPPEPDVDVVWVVTKATAATPSVTMRWARSGATAWKSDTGAFRYWRELLDLGLVHDVNPELADFPPTPLSWDGHEIRDARGWIVGSLPKALIVRAVNAYAARLDQS